MPAVDFFKCSVVSVIDIEEKEYSVEDSVSASENKIEIDIIPFVVKKKILEAVPWSLCYQDRSPVPLEFSSEQMKRFRFGELFNSAESDYAQTIAFQNFLEDIDFCSGSFCEYQKPHVIPLLHHRKWRPDTFSRCC